MIDLKTFLKTFTKLSEDVEFEEKFMSFLEESISNYHLKLITHQELDELIWQWILSFIIDKREHKLDNLLGEN